MVEIEEVVIELAGYIDEVEEVQVQMYQALKESDWFQVYSKTMTLRILANRIGDCCVQIGRLRNLASIKVPNDNNSTGKVGA